MRNRSLPSRRAVRVSVAVGALVLGLIAMAPVAGASVTKPGVPTGVTATPGSASAVAKWTAPTNDGGSPILGYTVTASRGSSTSSCTTTVATTCTVRGLPNGYTYLVSVKARNAKRFGVSSAPVPVRVGAPVAPTDVVVGNWETSTSPRADWTLQLNWLAPADNGSAIKKYTATSTAGSKSCVADGETSCTMSGFTAPSYTFTVTATNSRGTGPKSVQSAPVDFVGAAMTGGSFSSSDISAYGSDVWVSDWVDSTVVEYHSNGLYVRTTTVGNGNNPVAISSDGTHVWVADEGGFGYGGNTVNELDASDGSLVQTIPVGSSPDAISSDGTDVWVANFGDDTVTELDASDGSLVQTIPVGENPAGISSDGTHVWVANYGDDTVTELDASDGSVVRTIPIGAAPGAIDSDGTHVWVGAGDEVIELHASNGSVVRTIPVALGAYSISSNGDHVWLGGNGVTELKASTGSLVAVIETPAIDTGTAVSSLGANVWIANPSWGPPTDMQTGYLAEVAG
jgi:YVTN family beta-propeller protein